MRLDSDVLVIGAGAAGIYAALVMGVAIVASKWAFLYFLYRQKIFLKA